MRKKRKGCRRVSNYKGEGPMFGGPHGLHAEANAARPSLVYCLWFCLSPTILQRIVALLTSLFQDLHSTLSFPPPTSICFHRYLSLSNHSIFFPSSFLDTYLLLSWIVYMYYIK